MLLIESSLFEMKDIHYSCRIVLINDHRQQTQEQKFHDQITRMSSVIDDPVIVQKFCLPDLISNASGGLKKVTHRVNSLDKPENRQYNL